jgi:hypothetical protein
LRPNLRVSRHDIGHLYFLVTNIATSRKKAPGGRGEKEGGRHESRIMRRILRKRRMAAGKGGKGITIAERYARREKYDESDRGIWMR